MPQSSHLRNLLTLNVATLFISTSGVLGRHIDMSPPVTIGFRALIAGLLIYTFCKWRKVNLKISIKDQWSVILGGVLLGAHWVSYFYSLRLSNVAIGMLSIFTYPVITALLEPLILKTKFQKIHLLLGALVLIGIYFLVPEFDFQNDHAKAVGLGVLSAVFYSLRNLVLKPKVHSYNGSTLMLYQVVVVGLCLIPFMVLMDTSPIAEQWGAVVILALLTTAIGHTLFLSCFRYFSITTASIISSIQPVYGILLGMIFLKEYPQLSTIFGGALILVSVVVESIRASKSKT